MHMPNWITKGQYWLPISGWFQLNSGSLWHVHIEMIMFKTRRISQDDVIKWNHFPRYWSFVRGTTGRFLSQTPVTQSLMCSLICLNKRLSKQSIHWWSETPSRPLWRHCNVPRALWYASILQHADCLGIHLTSNSRSSYSIFERAQKTSLTARKLLWTSLKFQLYSYTIIFHA